MSLNLDDFYYELPESRIAKHPPKERGTSKLLVYRQGDIQHHHFGAIVDQIPTDSTLVFNDTKVIPARIILYKDTGARIEIFLLEPLAPSKVHEEVMMSQSTCTWKCLIGNARKWKPGSSLENESIRIKATRTGEDEVTFEWEGMTFSQLLTEIGKIPLPPYIQREVEQEDKDRYQTVYSKMDGAVAAPTAGLHFTGEIMNALEDKGIHKQYVTLHVSAGTFQSIKTDDISQHLMHNEQVWIHRDTIESLLSTSQTIAVGTTSMRTLESLYWFGVRLHHKKEDFYIRKEDPYEMEAIEKHDALQNVLHFMDQHQLFQLGGQTEIFLYPGYNFKMCDGLITNYHLPNSTLILLVAAFIGDDWRKVYQEALNNNYRFLSYGDSSLLIP
jgi:S-adenosylmethionine:tRNA ribosyltransferase-isomerase